MFILCKPHAIPRIRNKTNVKLLQLGFHYITARRTEFSIVLDNGLYRHVVTQIL